jgi:hypothetical protein
MVRARPTFKAAKGGPSVKDEPVLTYIHHLLKWKGLGASAKALEKEAGLSKASIGSYSPGLAAQLWSRLSKDPKLDSDSDSDSDEESSSDDESKATQDDSVMTTVFFHANS